MKKILNYYEKYQKGIFSKKVIRVMKITPFLFILTIVQLWASDTYSQLTKLSLSAENKTVAEVLRDIENQSEFFFLYSPKLIDVEKKVSINKEEETIKNILLELFPEDVRFIVSDRQIVLTPAKGSSGLKALLQQQTITGKVTDASTGEPLTGVSIVVEGTSTGTVSDAKGNYSIDVPGKDAILVFSYMGYKTEKVSIAGQTVINIGLIADIKKLDEIVVVGYGIQTKKGISGSVVKISERDFNKGATRDATDMLVGKVAGLVITSGSGDVSQGSTIRLRGTSSLTGSSEPFVVIDGIPGIPLGSVNPQDIESISVLKDASAAAIYGSRSASGVILVTTKKGKKGKTSVEYEGYAAMDNVSNIPDVLDAAEWRDYTQAQGMDTQGMDRGANTNWFKEIMRTGFTQNHSLSMSGGGENHYYRGSFSYLDKEGVVKDNFMDRFNGRLIFSQKALKGKLNLTFTGAFTQKNYSPTDIYNFVLAYNMLPVVPVKNADGTWFESYDNDQGNPVRNIAYNSHLNKNSLYSGNIKADLEIVKGFVAGVNLLKQRGTNDFGEYYDSQTERGRGDNGYGRRTSWTGDKNLLEVTLNYKKVFGVHNVDVLGGYSYEDNFNQNFSASNRMFVTNSLGYHGLGSGEDLRSYDVSSGANMYKLISFFGRVNYTLRDKYIFMASYRRDGSSKFGKNHKWGSFPSVSAAWRMKDESFLKGVKFIDEMKLRVGYGTNGNQDNIAPYQTMELYGPSGKYYIDGKWYQSYKISQNANPNLKWEQTSMLNIGLDYGLFDNRLNGTIDYYEKNTTDLLYTYRVPVPPYPMQEMIANVGAMSNKGIEVLVNADIVRKKEIRWNVSVNFARNKNKITKLSDNEFQTSSIKIGSAFVRGNSSTTTHIIEEGREAGTFYGWLCKGLDADGKYIMDDIVDGIAGLTDDDRTYIGSAQPKFTYGFSNTVTYKKWDFNFFLRGVCGNDLLNYSRMSYATTQWLPGANVLKEALTNGLDDNPIYSSYYIEKGSFLRLDNASIAYNFNTKGLWGIEKLKVYVTAQNLFTITKYKGLDPEVEMSGLTPGIEGRDYYPKSRTFSLGISLGF